MLNDSAKRTEKSCLAPVVHTCNPSFSGGKDQENGGLKPVRENSSGDPT
jgi:hypothetical protein